MKESYIDHAGFTPHEESDLMIRLKVLAGEIYQQRVYAEYVLRQMFPSTATGEYLDMHAAERGLTRKQATKARGSVSFYPAEETHGDILIPAGTVVSTGTDALRCVTDESVTLTSNAVSVDAAVTAANEGAAYNVRSGTLTVLVTPVLGIGSVSNGAALAGGTDAESDDELRARVIDSYVNISNGANAAYYRSIAMTVDGVRYASVIGCERGAGTVNVYVLGDGAQVTNAQLNEVQSLLNTGRELNVDVRACRPTQISVNLYIRLRVEPGYVFSAVSEQVRQAVTDFVNTLGIGRDVLLSEVGEVIYHIKGVSDYKFLESYGSDCTISASQFAHANHITVSEV